jgi:hypothetical protein
VIEQQLVWAREFGVSFFVCDWYFKAKVFSPEENLNSALQLTHALRDRHGMQYAILYVNHPPFGITPNDWTSAVPQVRPEAAPAPPIVLIEAWNELSEGSYLVPTVGDGKAYGTALADVLVRGH